MSVPYHHVTNGLVERCFRTLRQGLRGFCNDAQSDWPTYLGALTDTYNTSAHESTKLTPYLVVFGREARLSLDELVEEPTTAADANSAANQEYVFSEQYAQELQASFKTVWAWAGKASPFAKNRMK